MQLCRIVGAPTCFYFYREAGSIAGSRSLTRQRFPDELYHRKESFADRKLEADHETLGRTRDVGPIQLDCTKIAGVGIEPEIEVHIKDWFLTA